MAKFPICIWNYDEFEELNVKEAVKDWAECGLTMAMTPKIHYGKTDYKVVVDYLDEAAKYDIKLIANVYGLMYGEIINSGEEEYEKRFREIYSVIKHPALYGFFIGDEPGEKDQFAACVSAFKIQKRIAPELTPYVNFHTCMDDTPEELLGGKNFREWLKDYADLGLEFFSYGHYDQVWDDNGIDSFFRNIRPQVEAADEAGIDCWNTQLSSAHYMFRIPSYYDLMWQLTCAAACGSRGVNWFRFYDRRIGHNEHGSAIDEFGNKTTLYYDMLRANRRFNINYGELIMSLKRQSTYFTQKTMGTYPLFTGLCHPALKAVRSTEQGIVSFFKAEDGTEYLCVVNASMTNPGVFRLEFDKKEYTFMEVLDNGKQDLGAYNRGYSHEHWDGQWMYPGEMAMFRIEHKPTPGYDSYKPIWNQ